MPGQWISLKISLKFVPEFGINNIPALVQIMGLAPTGDKPLSAPVQGWGQLHNINSNSNSNSRGFNANSNSNSGQSPEYQLQLQLQLRRFQLQLQFQLWQISRISTPTPTPEVSTPTPIPTPKISNPIPTPTPEFQIQPQLHFKSNQSCSTKLPLRNYNVMWNIVWIKWRYAVDICHVVPNIDQTGQHWHSRW